MNVLVLNYPGLGNGLLALSPLLAICRHARPDSVYYTSMAFHRTLELAGFDNLVEVPEEWHDTRETDLDDIISFVDRQRIRRVVNLTNEDFHLPRKQGWHSFRGDLQKRNIELWDVKEHGDETAYIVSQWKQMFDHFGMAWEDARIASPWLCDQGIISSEKVVGIYLGASRQAKQVSFSIWRTVIRRLVSSGFLSVRLIAYSHEEKEFADSSARGCDADRIEAVQIRSPLELIRVLRQCSTLISNDTLAMHLGVQLGVPTVGCFSTTRRAVWGAPECDTFVGISASSCRNCAHMPVQGVCFSHPALCSSPPWSSFDPDQIAQQAFRMAGCILQPEGSHCG
jgi:hypothetical protein